MWNGPSFLYRERTPETRAIVDIILAQSTSAQRTWAPIRKIEDIRRAEQSLTNRAENPADEIFIDDKTLPVQVVTTKKKNLQFFDNFEAFAKFHDFEDFPVKETFSGGGVTYVVVKSDAIKNNISDALRDIETPKVEIVEQNGVKRPKNNSLCGKAWAVYDQTLTGMTFNDAFKLLEDGGMNKSTIRTQFAHWKKFNAISVAITK